jgi:predicted transcriptional regulator
MKLSSIAEQLGLTAMWIPGEDREVTRGYASDMLSDVLARAPRGALLATLQVHLNVVAVAAQAGLSGVIFTNGKRPDAHVIERAEIEKIPLFVTEMDTFTTAGRLFAIGVKGRAL